MTKNKDNSLSNAEENQADLKSELSNTKIGSKKKHCTKKSNKKCLKVS